MQMLVLTLDLCGTFAFALGGAMEGVRRRLDVFGVLVVAFVASSFGGIVRDLLIGAVPPAALLDWRYLAVSLAAGLMAFFCSSLIERLRSPARVLDAVGLAFFCVAGAEKALAFGLGPLMAALLGMLTGIGGGIARDVLLAQVPARPAFRVVRARRARRCRHRRGGRAARAAARALRDRRRARLFLPANDCHPARLEAANRRRAR
jgi:uncharacterized membrane protein YeiH